MYTNNWNPKKTSNLSIKVFCFGGVKKETNLSFAYFKKINALFNFHFYDLESLEKGLKKNVALSKKDWEGSLVSKQIYLYLCISVIFG